MSYKINEENKGLNMILSTYDEHQGDYLCVTCLLLGILTWFKKERLDVNNK